MHPIKPLTMINKSVFFGILFSALSIMGYSQTKTDTAKAKPVNTKLQKAKSKVVFKVKPYQPRVFVHKNSPRQDMLGKSLPKGVLIKKKEQ